MDKQAELKIQTTQKMAEIIIKSLSPELNRRSFRAKVELKLGPTGDELNLIIKAQDVNALRAALNSYLRWINCIIELDRELVGKGEENGSNENSTANAKSTCTIRAVASATSDDHEPENSN